jgi:recombination protein RecT
MNNAPVVSPVNRLKDVMSSPTVQEQFRNCLQNNAPLFVSSLIDLYGSDQYLQKCEPRAVVMEALKAATLKLPINKSLGFAYIIPFKNKSGQQIPQFQIGYKGLLQLAMRSGQYRSINADKVYEGELKRIDKLSGNIVFGDPTGSEVIGYFAHIETVNWFGKSIFWSVDQVTEHAKRFSESFKSKKDWVVQNSPWSTDFDAMATKTVLKALLGKYGIMSIEMATAFESDSNGDFAGKVQKEIDAGANTQALDFGQMTEEEKAEIMEAESAAAEAAEDPGY